MRTSVRDLPRFGLRPPPPALDTGNPTIALAAAAELEFVSLPDALELVLLLVGPDYGPGPSEFLRSSQRRVE
jgi:hypothetical protein